MVGLSVPPFVRGCPVWWSRVLVGLLFEICIVDASILQPAHAGCECVIVVRCRLVLSLDWVVSNADRLIP